MKRSFLIRVGAWLLLCGLLLALGGCAATRTVRPSGNANKVVATAGDVEILYDELYYLATGGGVTFGGGEPLLYPAFLNGFRELCGPNWHLCAETSLSVPQENVRIAAQCLDMFYVDCKDTDPDIYRRAAEKIGRPVEEIIFLDDNYNADKTAREAGMQVWGVYDDTSAEYEAEIRSVTQRYIRNFREILAE